jgi:hypothetical protein
VACWEAQSQISTAVLLGLTAFVSPAAAMLVIVTWSLIATVVYSRARAYGLPDLLDRPLEATPRKRLATYLFFLPRCLLAGVQPMFYTQTAGRLLALRGNTPFVRAVRGVVVGVGLVLFGVTPAEHLARRAGLQGASLLRVCLLGPFLNVPYRVFLSGLLLGALRSIMG